MRIVLVLIFASLLWLSAYWVEVRFLKLLTVSTDFSDIFLPILFFFVQPIFSILASNFLLDKVHKSKPFKDQVTASKSSPRAIIIGLIIVAVTFLILVLVHFSRKSWDGI